jgi:hypothetical protein
MILGNRKRMIQTAVAAQTAKLSFTLRKDKLRQAHQREGGGSL